MIGWFGSTCFAVDLSHGLLIVLLASDLDHRSVCALRTRDSQYACCSFLKREGHTRDSKRKVIINGDLGAETVFGVDGLIACGEMST